MTAGSDPGRALTGAEIDETREWLEADGLGGYASGTVNGVRTRRYHTLLMPATAPPSGRVALVNGFDAWLALGDERVDLTTQRYATDSLGGSGAERITAFDPEPWPTWTYELPGGIGAKLEIFVVHGAPITVIAWSFTNAPPNARLVVRPFLSGRDMHSLHHQNGAFDFDPRQDGPALVWSAYLGLPAVRSIASATYRHDPAWYRNFQYDQERERGLDFTEDLASPGEYIFDLAAGDPVWVLASDGAESVERLGDERDARSLAGRLRREEGERRGAFPDPLHRSADQYLVKRGDGLSIIAGYPWFSDWGRDTFISIRGLCIATGRLEEAEKILLAWSRVVSEGMLPNYFPEGNAAAEFNSVDASLWFVIAVHDLLAAREASGEPLGDESRAPLIDAVLAIVRGYAAGTRFGIRADADGLLAAGQPGYQLTWMDARVGDQVITPRIGKPVEVQALWINALTFAATLAPEWQAPLDRALDSFQERFWNEAGGYLYDVVDVDHQPGTSDATFRPNQVLAVGGLPHAALRDPARARAVVDAVEARLATPLALRSLAPDEPGYVGRYQGGPAERDGHYHQGTVWPWLAGPFIDAWIAVRGGTPEARAEAAVRFLRPLEDHLREAGIGHVSEIADADAPWTPRGCPFQAWSVGELLRIRLRIGTAN